MQHVDFRYGDNKCRERATHFFSTRMAAALRRWPEARGTSNTAMRSGGIPTLKTNCSLRPKHAVVMSGRVSMRTLYISPRLCRTVPRRCLVINISSLLRELILHACQFSKLRKRVVAEQHVIELILDKLKLVESIPIQLPHPHDSRARKLADRLRTNPREQRSLQTSRTE